MAILAAVNGEQEKDRAVSTGYEIARAYDEELVVLHVMPQEQFDNIHEATSEGSIGYVAGDAGLAYIETNDETADDYYLDEATEDAANVAQRVVDGTLDDPENVSPSGRVGDPTEEILEEAERVDARYLVIGGRKRSPVGKAVFGSITQSILLDADTPVVTVMEGEE